jgi:hypothetical protein
MDSLGRTIGFIGVGAALVLGACSTGEENTTTAGFTASSPTASSPTGFTTTAASTSAGTDGTDTTDGTDSDRTTGDTDPTGHETETMGGTTMAPVLPTCDDGEQNQDESDVDCGGPNCPPCAAGSMCADDSDCATESCVGNVCITPACDDGVKNGDETDVDCGGACAACGDGLGCTADADCLSGVCSGSFCAMPSCGDGVQNGDETDADCGGGTCMGCAEGLVCAGDSDCLSQYCMGGACAPADCLGDADCSDFNSACTVGVCTDQKTCESQAANEGQGCDDNQACTTGETCQAGACAGGVPVDCSNLSDQCNVGQCDPDSGQCEAAPANEGNPCNDNNACTAAEKCTAGACVDPGGGEVFYEDFADNSAGWSLGSDWQIAATQTSSCASCPGSDPGLDHTSTGDNGVAGVLIGACTPSTLHDYYCITSPNINTSALGSASLTYWRHLHSDYTPYMRNKVEVSSNGGNAWTEIWATGGSPCTNDQAWTQQSFDVTAYKSAQFRVRFCYNVASNGVFSSGSWSLDDVTVAPTTCTP